MADFKVNLLGMTENPQTLSVAGALSCFEEKSSAQLYRELLTLSAEQRWKRERGVLKNSFGRGHGSVGDQNYFIFSIEDLPRAATFQLCLPEYLAHLQQSLRRARATRGFYLPEVIENSGFAERVKEILSRSFELYERMLEAGILEEDARFLLPLYTKTNIQTGGDARELCHLWQMSHREGVPSVATSVVEEMLNLAASKAPYLFKNYGHNYETLAWFPAAQLYSLKNVMMERLIRAHRKCKEDVIFLGDDITFLQRRLLTKKVIEEAIRERDETVLANLKHIHFSFLVKMSLACFHQAIRQRTWNHTTESIYDALEDALGIGKGARMVIPPSIKRSRFNLRYEKQHIEMLNLYKELTAIGIPQSEAIGVVPHSLKIHTSVHINGWNAIHSIGKRTCLTAQWEIRKLAQKMARRIKEEVPVLGKWAKPQCITYGKCPEGDKECVYYKKYLGG